MSKIDHGGFAYPVQQGETQDGRWNPTFEPGPTLLDRIAMQMAPAIWDTFNRDGTNVEHDDWRKGVAIEAYRLADELVAEKRRRESEK